MRRKPRRRASKAPAQFHEPTAQDDHSAPMPKCQCAVGVFCGLVSLAFDSSLRPRLSSETWQPKLVPITSSSCSKLKFFGNSNSPFQQLVAAKTPARLPATSPDRQTDRQAETLINCALPFLSQLLLSNWNLKSWCHPFGCYTAFILSFMVRTYILVICRALHGAQPVSHPAQRKTHV